LVLDDILDEGITLRRIVDACHADGAASVHTAVLVSKEREHACEADVVGVQVADRYLYGYGLDYKDYFRNAAGIYAVATMTSRRCVGAPRCRRGCYGYLLKREYKYPLFDTF
jgi:hypoxanthine-guanine phosphoribosyltransferase